MMQDVFKSAAQLTEANETFALCTVVGTKGSTPQKPGAMLLVKSDGTGVGTLGGGCVEADVWAEAKSLLSSVSGATVGDFELNDEIAAESGMVCGGTMSIMVDPLRASDNNSSWIDYVLNSYSGGKSIAIGTIAGPEDHPKLGTKVLVHENGSYEGDLGGEKLNDEVVKLASELLTHGGTRTLQHGDSSIFIQGFVSPPHLVLCGGGHISHAIAPLAKKLGFIVSVIDDRLEFANHERFPSVDNIVVGDFEDGFDQLTITPNTFVVIATRGHNLDDAATLSASRTAADYIGLVGSIRKSILIFEELLAEGVSYDRVASIRAPIGLDIGARTPDEIALSIIAEIQQVRLGGEGRPLKMAEKHVQKAAEKATRRLSV